MNHAFEGIQIFAQYVLPAVIGAGSLGICILLLRRMKQLHGRVVRSEAELQSASETWGKNLTALEKEVETMEEAAKTPGARDGANATIRRKVLRMHRLGTSPEHIAQALKISKGEVALLLKVHTIILRPFESQAGEYTEALIEQKS